MCVGVVRGLSHRVFSRPIPTHIHLILQGEGVWGGMGCPEGTLGYCTRAQEAVSTKRKKKMGSPVAYNTRGTFLSQRMRHKDASGRATDK